ncbi:MAG: DUF2780 domain-containing protein [Planctomycetota bacterium]
MDELIKLITSQVGIDESAAGSGINKTMAMLKKHAGDDLFGQIASAIPGADDAASAGITGEQPASDGGGMFGKLAGMASSALGGSAGEGLELGATLSELGIGGDKLSPFIKTLVDFIREKAGDEVLDQLLAKFPLLKTLLG